MTYFIGIGGSTDSAKTELATNLAYELAPLQTQVMSLSSYYTTQQDLTQDQLKLHNFDHPDAIDIDLACQQLDELASGGEVPVPVHDFKSYSRSDSVQIVEPSDIVIVTGSLLLAFQSLRNRMDYIVYAGNSTQQRFHSRQMRDAELGRPEDLTHKQFSEHALPMHNLFVSPLKHHAIYSVDAQRHVIETATEIAMAVTRSLANAERTS